jgi:hypothetical protein
MSVHLDLSALRKTKWSEYAVRFLFGGTITTIAGLLAKHFGPVLGGLFLAFPAIFPASATLVEKHEKQKKQKAGMTGTKRGRQAAALDARGAAMGSLGLICYAVVVWKALPAWDPVLVLVLATAVWFTISALVWKIQHKYR